MGKILHGKPHFDEKRHRDNEDDDDDDNDIKRKIYFHTLTKSQYPNLLSMILQTA